MSDDAVNSAGASSALPAKLHTEQEAGRRSRCGRSGRFELGGRRLVTRVPAGFLKARPTERRALTVCLSDQPRRIITTSDRGATLEDFAVGKETVIGETTVTADVGVGVDQPFPAAADIDRRHAPRRPARGWR